MRRSRVLLACLVTSALASCSCGDRGGAADAGPPPRELAKRPLPAEAATDPVAFARGLVPPRKGACAQVRSIPDEPKANEIAEAIRKALALPVDLLRADLGDKGVWFRVCVGDEESPARLIAKAAQWTAPGGPLEPFLDEPQEGAPRFFVKERESAEPRAAAPAAARALLELALVPDAPLVFAGGPTADTLMLAGTAYEATSTVESGVPARSLVVTAAPSGALRTLESQSVAGCASCEVLLRDPASRLSARVVSAGDLWPTPGDELLVEERSAHGDAFLSVVVATPASLDRVAGVLLARATAGVLLSGVARVVDADLDSQREVVVKTTELRLQGDDGCVLESHAALYDATPTGLARVELGSAATSPSAPAAPAHAGVVDGGSAGGTGQGAGTAPSGDGSLDRAMAAAVALDAAGDYALASRTCASLASSSNAGASTRYCLERVRTLLAEGRALEATNAGALLAEAAPQLRALVATPFFSAASVLDADPRLLAAPPDCATAPLVTKTSTRGLDENLRLAAARAKERLSLGDVADAVFVVAIRDFGAETPVGAIAAKWLDRMQLVLPARHAAIEALLLPPATEPLSTDAGPQGGGGPGFGGEP